MSEKVQGLIKRVYAGWKKNKSCVSNHLDEETIACFLDQKLSNQDIQQVKQHVLDCLDCSKKLALNLKIGSSDDINVPDELINKTRETLFLEGDADLLEVLIKLKEKLLEVIKSSGDILVGQELVPAPLLRSRNIKEFKDEVTILKDFKEILAEVRILNKAKGSFDCIIKVKNKMHQGLIKDIRITLFTGDLELESYLLDSGSVAFEHIKLGKYRLEIISEDRKLASIALEVVT